MNPTPAPPPSPARSRKAALAVLALGLCTAAVGGLVAFSALSGPRNATASETAVKPKNAASAIEAGLAAAATYQRDARYPEAAAVLAKLTEEAPTDKGVRLAYAQALMGQRKFADAYAQYEAALALAGAPKFTDGAGNRTPDTLAAGLHFEAGTCANQAGLVERAEEHYAMAGTADPAEPRYPLYLAMMQIKRGNDEAAMASLLRATHLKEDLAEAWGTIAELELKKNRLELASQHVERARQLQPQLAKWRVVEARILNRRNRPDQAATLLLSLDPSQRRDPAVLSLLAESYGLLQRPADAAAMYADAYRAAPSEAELAYQAALWYDRAGDAARSAEHARIAAMLGHETAKELAKPRNPT